MASVHTTIDRPADAVMAVLLDPMTYPQWLVGCKEMRAIDPEWPAPGSRFHHRFGVAGPIAVDDVSRVLAVQPRSCLRLEVRARPAGRGEATFTVEALSPDRCQVDLAEVPIGLLTPARPLVAPLTVVRNRKSLERLRAYVESVPSGGRGPT